MSPQRLGFLIAGCPLGLLLMTLTAMCELQGDEIDFNRDVRPILSDKCYQCHGPDEQTREGDLRLDTKDAALADRGGYAAFIPHRPEESDALRRVFTEDEDERMPPSDSTLALSDAEKELLKRWVEQGATWTEHWAFIRPVMPALPLVKRTDWPNNEIDRFVLARIEAAGLQPSSPADKRTLIRRVTLDLTGLPPTVAEVNRFLADGSPLAYERVVDQLLQSPRYGERMAWEWLDAARYADTDGFQGDPTRTMWPWRDWLMQAINDNMPFDQFTIEMIAGDLLPNATSDQIVATGFNRNHMHNGEGGRIAEETRVENVFDRTETTSTVWLGLTMTCARCHDHKYDPVTQNEYYQLFAFFNNTSEDGRGRSGKTPPVVTYHTLLQTQQLETLGSQISHLAQQMAMPNSLLDQAQAAWEAETAGRLANQKTGDSQDGLPTDVADIVSLAVDQRSEEQQKRIREYYRGEHSDQWQAWAAEKSTLEQARDGIQKSAATVMVMDRLSDDKRRTTSILERGTYNKPNDSVSAGTPSFLPPLPPDARRDRLTLAQWLVSDDNPLTARVTVNRYWQVFFRVGLVETSEDFGRQGALPTHPDLLDWLAATFMQSGWDVKALHKRIVMSATYRQSSHAAAVESQASSLEPQTYEIDPDNRLLARGARFRMPSWMLRDQALFVSGRLAGRIGGPAVRPYQPSGIWADATFGKIRYQQETGSSLYRRSIYTFWRRIVGPTMFFDGSKRQTCEVKQTLTNTPLHALTTLNETTFVEAARNMAERTIKEGGQTLEERVDYAFQMVTARLPNADERQRLIDHWRHWQETYRDHPDEAGQLLDVGESVRDKTIDASQHAAFTLVCSLLLNLDEVLTKE